MFEEGQVLASRGEYCRGRQRDRSRRKAMDNRCSVRMALEEEATEATFVIKSAYIPLSTRY